MRSRLLTVALSVAAVTMVVVGAALLSAGEAPDSRDRPSGPYRGLARTLDKFARGQASYVLSVAEPKSTQSLPVEGGHMDLARGSASVTPLVGGWPEAVIVPETTYARLGREGQDPQWVAIPVAHEVGLYTQWTPVRLVMDILGDPRRYLKDPQRLAPVEFRGKRWGRAEARLDHDALQALAEERRSKLDAAGQAIVDQQIQGGQRGVPRGTFEIIGSRRRVAAFIIRVPGGVAQPVTFLVELIDLGTPVRDAPQASVPYAQWFQASS